MIIAIDFDGTIVTSAYPAIGSPIPGAADYIRRLHADGHYIIIWTCRTGIYLSHAIAHLHLEEIPFDAVNRGEPTHTARYGGEGPKVHADIYIDDRQIGGLPAWYDIYSYISDKARTMDYNQQQHYKREKA